MHQTSSQQVGSNAVFGLGVALGSAFGAALGVLFDNLALGVGVGTSIGVAIGLSLGDRAEEGDRQELEEVLEPPPRPASARAAGRPAREGMEGIEGLPPRELFRAAMGRTAGDGDDSDAAQRAAQEEQQVRAQIEKHLPGLELTELLGRGGMGYVYRARQPKLDREVALKVVAPAAEQQRGFTERFAREARALARLNHPGIVAVHDFGQNGPLSWLLMEYVDGSNLRDVICAGKLEPAEALALVPKICEALQFAHDQGVVHRDVKPENILLDRAGNVKIADFGLAKLTESPGTLAGLTGSRQVLGTFRYMAPEQLDRPLEVDHRADIYSLGVVFYEMLTGEIPMGRFDAPSLRSRASQELDAVVMRALEKEPERRYQHASDVKTELDSIERGDRQAAAGSMSRPSNGQSERALSVRAVLSAVLSTGGFVAFLFMLVYLLRDAFGSASNPGTGDADPSMRLSLAKIAALFMGGSGLVSMVMGGALGFRALREIRDEWPRYYGSGAAVHGAWVGVLLIANTFLLIVGLELNWERADQIPLQVPIVAGFMLLAADAAFVLWYRHRFLQRCSDA